MTALRPDLKPFAWLSIAAALVTIVLKTGAWWLTGSVGLLSDAMESLINLAGALMALWMLSVAEQPPDAGHAYGHGKAEYFSSGFEGVFILIAALAIGWTGIERLLHPRALERIDAGLLISAAAALVNLAVARVLMRAGRRHRSITLEADAHHLMTDVWTSVGVIVGVGAVAFTGWLWLDPLLALAVAVNILWTGYQLIRRSTDGLMDKALPAEQQKAIEDALETYRLRGIGFHQLLTRQSGAHAFVSLHMLVPGKWCVQRAHDESEDIERAIRAVVPHAHVLTHIEPVEDPLSHQDSELDL